MFEVNTRPNLNVKKAEKLYSEKDGVPVKYVCTTDLNGENFSYDIFYREIPHPEFGNRYFALYRSPYSNGLYIRNADSVENLKFEMVQNKDTGKWEYSHDRHDFYTVGDVSIDGGRAYLKLVGNLDVEIKTFKVKDGKFVEL